jgi:hypothetical protein
MLGRASFSFKSFMRTRIVCASVSKRTAMPALSRLKVQTSGGTVFSAAAGKRSNHRNRSSSSQSRPSTPHEVTSCHATAGGAADNTAGMGRVPIKASTTVGRVFMGVAPGSGASVRRSWGGRQ